MSKEHSVVVMIRVRKEEVVCRHKTVGPPVHHSDLPLIKVGQSTASRGDGRVTVAGSTSALGGRLTYYVLMECGLPAF